MSIESLVAEIGVKLIESHTEGLVYDLNDWNWDWEVLERHGYEMWGASYGSTEVYNEEDGSWIVESWNGRYLMDYEGARTFKIKDEEDAE